MRMDRRRSAGAAAWALVAALVALGAGASDAGVVFFAGKLEDGRFVAAKEAGKPCFSIRYSTITVSLDGNRAATETQETVAGPKEGEVAVVGIIPLPKGVDGKSVAVTAKRQGAAAARLEARFLSAAQAQKLYESIAEGTGSVAAVTFSGRPVALIPALRLGQKLDLSVSFRQTVRETDGLLELRCPMPAAQFAKEPVGRVTLTAALKNERPLRGIFSPSHAATVERKGLCEATVRVAADDWPDGSDFRLFAVADEDPLGLRVLTHRGADDEEGFFLVFGNPTGSPEPEKAIEKDVLFVLDTSGSMRGEKIEQARAAIEYCLEHLNEGDRFNIVTFGTEVTSFRKTLTVRSPKSLRAANAFADEVVAQGRTNISGALAAGLAGTPQAGRPRIMIFLTDGTPTAGELVPENIVKKLAGLNGSGTRIFVMGVGHDVNAHLLDRLAEESDGSSEYVEPSEEIDVKVAALYNRLSHPVLTNCELAFGELRTHSVFPKKVPALFQGSEIMVAGRFREGGTHTVSIAGTLHGKPRKYSCTVDFPAKGTRGPEFVATLWAARNIGYLLQQIRLHGENEELVKEVVRLSHKFGIVTEYTTFLAMADTVMSEADAAKTAVANMRRANREQAGQWAFNQAQNDQGLQQRIVTNNAANTYRDRRGRVQTVANVRQVGRRAFYLRKGRWVDAEVAGDRKTRKVKLFSKEYFTLLRNNREFAKAQGVGWNVDINIGSERIVVEK